MYIENIENLNIMFSKILRILIFALLLAQVRTHTNANDINILVQNSILSNIDGTINPCDDFYTHACGRYEEQHVSQDYKEITTLLDQQYNVFVLELLDSLYGDYGGQEGSSETKTFVAKTLNYFQSCRRESKRNLSKYFVEIKPGPQLNWPIWEELANNTTEPFVWSGEATFDIWTLLGSIQSYGLNNVLINQQILVQKNGRLEIMLEPHYLENNSTLPDLKILAVLLLQLGVTQPKTILRNLLQTNKVLLDILEISKANQGRIQELTYKDLKSQYGNLNLNLYLKELVNQELPPDTLVLIKNPQYFQYLNDNMSRSFEKTDLCNYLMLKFLHFLALDSTRSFKSLDCIKDLRMKMDLAVNFLYYYHNYGHKADLYNPAIWEIYQNVKEKMQEIFHENHLNLTFRQKQFLTEKLQNMQLNIGNLPENVSILTVEKLYENITELDKDNYYKNHLILLKHNFHLNLLYKGNLSHYLGSQFSRPAAFYVAQQNMIVLPFSSLRYPLFDINYHDVYKYSNLGFILAHELAHGFETFGLNFGSKGEFLKSPYLIAANENYQSALECFRSQLATKSLNERIADILAIDITSKIYETKYQNQTSVHTRNKYFYLNLAQFFCGKKDIKFIDHDTDAQRLNQIVMNSKGFASTFHCDRKSKMNPRKKCRLY